MPDLVADTRGRLRRSRRRFALVMTTAALALVLGAGAFAWSLADGTRTAHQAATEARQAATEARQAAAHADAAHAQADRAAADLCDFLAAVRGERIDERAEARRLYLLFKCKSPPQP